MRQSLLINILRLLRAQENKALVLWDKAKPISLHELEARLIALTNKSVKEIPAPNSIELNTESFEELLAQLEKKWAQLEDIDDCSVI